MIKLQISHIISTGENDSTHHRTSFRRYNAAYYINLSYKHSFKQFMHKINLYKLCQTFMHLWVQQSAEA
jgi:hypothetical protein